MSEKTDEQNQTTASNTVSRQTGRREARLRGAGTRQVNISAFSIFSSAQDGDESTVVSSKTVALQTQGRAFRGKDDNFVSTTAVTTVTTVSTSSAIAGSKIPPIAATTDESTLAAGRVEEIDDAAVEEDGGDDDEAIDRLISEAGAVRVSDDEEFGQPSDDEIELHEAVQSQSPPSLPSPKRDLVETGVDESPKRRRTSWLQARQSLENSLAIDPDTPTKDHSRLESPIESPFVSPVATRSSRSAAEAQAPARASRQRSLGSQRRSALTTASIFPALANTRRRKVILPIFTHSDSEDLDADGDAGNDSDEDYVEGNRSHDTFNLTIYKVPPTHGGTLIVNAVDVAHQVVVNHLSRFLKHDKRMREARPAVRRAFARYRTLVHDHLLQLGDLVDGNAVLVARVRAATAARNTARSQLLELRDERMRVQRRMEQIRHSHAEQAAKLNEAREVDFFLADLEQSRSGTSVSADISNEDDDENSGTRVGTAALNKVLLNLDLIRPKVGRAGATLILERAAQKLEYLDQNLSF